jgi:hypothetical protein
LLVESSDASNLSRLSAMRQLEGQLCSALDLSDRLEEFLLSAHIALALDSARAALVAVADAVSEREVGLSAG